MYRILPLILVFSQLNVMGQTAQSYLDKGVEFHRMKNYTEALENYNKAIELNDELTAAYFNRGTVYIALENIKEALNDFTQTIELDNSFIRAYYSRASIYVEKKEYEKAIDDLNSVVELNAKYPNALILRGNLRIAEDDVIGGCKDFNRALLLGDRNAARFIKNNCDFDSSLIEYVRVQGLEHPSWKVGNQQENDELMVIEYLKIKESFENWTEMATSQTIKGMNELGVDRYMKVIKDQALKSCKGAKTTILARNDTTEFPWIIFSIECNNDSESQGPQSQIWHIIQGEISLYTNSWVVKRGVLSAADKNKWIGIFKSVKVHNRLKE